MHRKTKMVSWMSGLVIGLQNRAQRFESARDLPKQSQQCGCFFCWNQLLVNYHKIPAQIAIETIKMLYLCTEE